MSRLPSGHIILGIDPGTQLMGFGLIAVQNRQVRLLEMGVLKLALRQDHYERLQKIHERVAGLIREYRPDTFAIEAPFFGKNVQSMLKLGRAQGVAIAAAMQAGIPVTEYSPKKVKQAVTGNGNANKEQVWLMLQRLLSFEEKPQYLDASDALAVALCHHFQQSNPLAAAASAPGGWAAFIARHPEKIRK
ncbi:crossover junction endodeoxyribonuclease RuvC [Compostibacter hankyongensis]|uniref:Crossover junction endodeoxyribonuclease RuvC n=1 Tax=Compostibacter hankyongensis TaxID=1007089 RepID=A0ABP8G9T0_9BACT